MCFSTMLSRASLESFPTRDFAARLREIIAIESNDSACTGDKLLEVLEKSRLGAGCGNK